MLSSQYNNTYKAFDTSIKNQGKLFLKNEKTYNQMVAPNLKLINETTIPNLHSVKEALQSSDSSQSNSSNYNNEYSSELENEFNRTLVQYNRLHKEINEDLLKKEQSKNKIKNYLGKVITEDDTNYKYVNNFGYTHRYSDEAWSENDNSCPNEALDVDNLNSFKLKGPSMGIGQPCNVAGKNIQNKSTNEIAWVDIKGLKHVYPEDVWNNKNKSCNIKPIQIENDSYNAIPNGSPMTDTFICNKIDINPKTWDKLISLNKKLKDLAYKLLNEIEKLNNEDVKINKIIFQKKAILLDNIQEIDENRQNIYLNQRQLVNVNAEKEDSELVLNSYFYRYVFWFILMLMILITTLRYLGNIDVQGDIIVIIVTMVIAIAVISYRRYNI